MIVSMAYCGVYFIQGIIQGIFIHSMLESRYNSHFYTIFWIFYSALGAATHLLTKVIPELSVLYSIVCLIAIYFVCFFLYQDSLKFRLIAPSLILCATIIADSVFCVILQFIMPDHRQYCLTICIENVILSFMATLIMIIVYLIILQLWRLIHGKSWKGSTVLIFLWPLALFCFSMNGTYNAINHSGPYDIYFFIGGILGLFLTIYYIYDFVYKAAKEETERELEQMRYIMELKEEHYMEIEKNREAIARMRHDFKNQILTVKQLISDKNKEEAEKLCSQMETSLQATNEYPYCAIPIVNAVLTEKSKECTEKGILLETDLSIQDDLNMNELDLCSLLTNLLDNAEHAVEKLDQSSRKVKISSIEKGGYLLIKTNNPSDKPKPPVRGHGTGTPILQSLAQKYGGNYTTEYKNGIFTAIVTLESNHENCNM